MNGKQAKKIRKDVYGDEWSPRHRTCRKDLKGVIHADTLRHLY